MAITTAYQAAKLLNFDVPIYDKYHKYLVVNIILQKGRHSAKECRPIFY